MLSLELSLRNNTIIAIAAPPRSKANTEMIKVMLPSPDSASSWLITLGISDSTFRSQVALPSKPEQ